MKTIQSVRDGKFSVEVHTFGSGEPLLYLHGAGGEQIDDVIDAALFYHELMDELGIDSAHIVGHSMGGMLAAEVAALDVHRAKRLYLVGSAGFLIDAHPHPDVFAVQ